MCRSCDLLALPYAEQLAQKHAALLAAFSAAGFSCPILPMIASDSTLPSRNKAKMAVGGSVQRPLLGFPAADFSIVDIPNCALLIAPIPEILARIQKLIVEFALEPYDIKKRSGELKYVLVRASETTGQVFVRLVLRSRQQIEIAQALLQKLQSEVLQIVVISVNLQPVPQAIIEGPEEIVFSKQDFIIDTFAGKSLVFSPQSFSQVTSNVADKLYRYVCGALEQHSVSTILDLYCGVGAFSVVSAHHVRRGVGVEISSQAIRNAIRAAELNSLPNLNFVAADVEAFLSTYSESVDCIIVNPPRRGLSDTIIKNIMRCDPRLLVYSSCNPQSLLRDLKLMQPKYSFSSIQPFDMFPLTSHIETVVVLKK